MINKEEETARYEAVVKIVKRDAGDDEIAEAKAIFVEIGVRPAMRLRLD